MPSRPHPEPKAPERPEVLRPTRPGLVQAYIREKIESTVEVEIDPADVATILREVFGLPSDARIEVTPNRKTDEPIDLDDAPKMHARWSSRVENERPLPIEGSSTDEPRARRRR